MSNDKFAFNKVKMGKVKRIAEGCCGMEIGQIYDAKIENRYYIDVLLPDGSWTGSHYAVGFFEVLSEVRNEAVTDQDLEALQVTYE